MNEKEAREIVARPEDFCDYPLLHQRFDMAMGYLAALEGPEVAALRAEIAELKKHYEHQLDIALDDRDQWLEESLAEREKSKALVEAIENNECVCEGCKKALAAYKGKS